MDPLTALAFTAAVVFALYRGTQGLARFGNGWKEKYRAHGSQRGGLLGSTAKVSRAVARGTAVAAYGVRSGAKAGWNEGLARAADWRERRQQQRPATPEQEAARAPSVAVRPDPPARPSPSRPAPAPAPNAAPRTTTPASGPAASSATPGGTAMPIASSAVTDLASALAAAKSLIAELTAEHENAVGEAKEAAVAREAAVADLHVARVNDQDAEATVARARRRVEWLRTYAESMAAVRLSRPAAAASEALEHARAQERAAAAGREAATAGYTAAKNRATASEQQLAATRSWRTAVHGMLEKARVIQTRLRQHQHVQEAAQAAGGAAERTVYSR